MDINVKVTEFLKAQGYNVFKPGILCNDELGNGGSGVEFIPWNKVVRIYRTSRKTYKSNLPPLPPGFTHAPSRASRIAESKKEVEAEFYSVNIICRVKQSHHQNINFETTDKLFMEALYNVFVDRYIAFFF